MKQFVSPEIQELIGAVHYRPAVSVIMPFEPKMGLKAELSHALEKAVDKVERELMENFPDDMSMLVIGKLKSLIKNLNYNTYKKSIAIFVSPVFEKLLYLDIAVEEKIIIDESFEIRDLVYSKKELHKYLVLLLSGKERSIYLGNSSTFVKILSSKAESVGALQKDLPGRVANFADMAERKETDMHKFLLETDKSLDIILKTYNLPLFVLGAERMLGHYKKITKHATAVVDYIQGNYEELSLPELKELLKPYVNDWKKIKQKNLLNKVEEAIDNKKLASGIRDVWREATGKKGSLLLVEKNYMYAAEHGSSDEIIYKATAPYNKFSYIKDAVDDVIEKVLENGGDVEFVDEGLLSDHQHIVLILYY